MLKISPLHCDNIDHHIIKRHKTLIKNDDNQLIEEVENGANEQIFSIYELLSNEHERRNSSFINCPVDSKVCMESIEKTNCTADVGRSSFHPSNNNNEVPFKSRAFKSLTLENEQLYHEGIRRRRKELLNSIILNRPIEMSWYRGLLLAPGIIIVGFLYTTPLTLIPAHDLLKHPDYWYEHIFHGLLVNISGRISQCFIASYVLNVTKIRSIRNIVFMVLIGSGKMILFIIGCYYTWTRIIGYKYPIPFLGLVSTSLFRALYFGSQWFCFPKEWRKNDKFRNQMKSYLMCVLIHYVNTILFTSLQTLLIKSSAWTQPFISLALPISREIFVWMSTKVVKNISNGDASAAIIINKFGGSIHHAISLCYLVTVVTDTTSWVLIFIDFAINIINCLRLVSLNIQEKGRKKKNPLKQDEQINILQDLALCELVEFIAPLTLILVIIVAYYGPNAKLFGNISNSYWEFKHIENIQETLKNMLFMFSIDFLSTILSSIILWVICGINLWKVFVRLLKEFGVPFSVLLGYITVVV